MVEHWLEMICKKLDQLIELRQEDERPSRLVTPELEYVENVWTAYYGNPISGSVLLVPHQRKPC